MQGFFWHCVDHAPRVIIGAQTPLSIEEYPCEPSSSLADQFCTLLDGRVGRESGTLRASPRSRRHLRIVQHTPTLVLPEGITASQGKVYVGKYNVFQPFDSRILVFNEQGRLLNTLGGKPGEELVGAGALLGLTIDPGTGDLYSANNTSGQVVRIQRPGSARPRVSLFGQLPISGAGPEDLNFGPAGRLYSSDSNLGLVWSFEPSGGDAVLEIGPPGSGARFSDKGLFASAVPGPAPNGIVFSADQRRLFVANTFDDSIAVFDVDSHGHVASDGRLFARRANDAYQVYPSGFDVLVTPQTRFGAVANTPLNGPDGLALDAAGRLWVCSIFGDNLTVLEPNSGAVLRKLGSSAATEGGVLNSPGGLTFVGDEVPVTNLGIFNGEPNTVLPYTVARLQAGVKGFGGNGNH